MHFFTRSITWRQALRIAATGLLLVGLSLTGAGCGVFGGNGEEEDDGGDEPDEPTAPAAPSNLTADAREASVQLSWASVDGADTYRVYRSSSPTSGVTGSPLDTGLSQTSFTDEDVETGPTYYYRVTAVDADGNESEGSGEVQSTPFTNPTDLEGTSGDSQVSLSWSAAAGADTYSVYRSQSEFDDVSGMNPHDVGIDGPSYTDPSAENGTKYYYRVTTVNPEGEESSASNQTAKTPFDEPDRP